MAACFRGARFLVTSSAAARSRCTCSRVSLLSVQKDLLTFASLKCVSFRVCKRLARAGVMVSAIPLPGAAILAEAEFLHFELSCLSVQSRRSSQPDGLIL